MKDPLTTATMVDIAGREKEITTVAAVTAKPLHQAMAQVILLHVPVKRIVGIVSHTTAKGNDQEVHIE